MDAPTSTPHLRPGNRLFVAAVIPPEVRGLVGRVARTVAERCHARPIPAGNLHVTLDFLGTVPTELGPPLIAAVTEALAGPPIPVDLGALRARPRASRARLVALELTDRDGLLGDGAARVRAAVDAVLGRPADPSPFWPHVTLVRLRRPGPVDIPPDSPAIAFTITRLALCDSLHAAGGPPTYRDLVCVSLTA